MLRIFVLLLILLTPALADAAAFTSTTTGNWNDGATWGNTSPGTEGTDWPGNGDTATIDAGDTVTVTANQIVGTSPASGNTVLTINNTGTLIIDDDVSFTVRGDTVAAGQTGASVDRIILNEGASWIFDSSLASSPSNTPYKLQFGAAGTFYHNPQLKTLGTSGNHCTITSDTDGTPGYITGENAGGLGCGSIDCVYTDLSYLGGASQNAILGLYLNAGAGTNFKFIDCTFDNCGAVWIPNSRGESVIILQRTRFTNTLHATYTFVHGGSQTLTTGTRLIDECSFDKQIGNSTNVFGFTITDNYIGHMSLSGSGTWASFDGNLVVDTGTLTVLIRGDMSNCYWLEHHSNSNVHGIQPLGIDVDMDITDCVIEATQTSNPGTGDLIICSSNPTNPRTLTVTGCILLPNAAGHSPGKIIAFAGGTNVTAVIEHNTYYTEGVGETGVSYGETYIGRAGMISSFRSNLAWGPGSSGVKLNQINSTTTPSDVAVMASTDYNAGWGIQAGSEGGGYNKTVMTAPMFTGTRGVDYAANDVDGVDPDFVDSTRNIASWGAANEGTGGTVDEALAVLQADPSKIAGMIAWVRAGFVPQNSAYDGTAHDAGDIGAMDYAVIAPVITTSATQTMEESERDVVTMAATDGTEPYVWSITGGADQALFAINSSTGALTMPGSADYENPEDADTNNVYVVEVTCTDDAMETDALTLNVTITDEGGAGTGFSAGVNNGPIR